jgi:fluoride exporter
MFFATAVFLGGGIGASLRYLISLFLKKYFGITHWATFIINVSGCLFLGFITSLALKNVHLIDTYLKLFLTTGIAGGFTTFSTFSYENIDLLKNGKILNSVIYTTLSVILGIIAVYCGFLLGNC